MPNPDGSLTPQEQEFSGWFGGYFTREIMPLLQRNQNEIIEAKVAALRNELLSVHPQVPSLDQLTAQVVERIKPDFQKTLDVIGEKLKAAGGGGSSVVAQEGKLESKGEQLQGLLGAAEHFIDYGIDKLLPAYEVWQRIKLSQGLTPEYLSNLRATDPVRAQIYAMQLNPNPWEAMLPQYGLNMMTLGAQQAFRMKQAMSPGGELSPQQPSSSAGSASSTGSPFAPPLPQTTGSGAPHSGVNMSNRNAKRLQSAATVRALRLADALKSR